MNNFSTYIMFTVLLILLNGCSFVDSTERHLTNNSPRQNVAENTPEQVIKEYTEIALRGDLDILDKQNKVEECCVVAAKPYVSPLREANVEYMEKTNKAAVFAVGMELLFDSLMEVEKRCQNEDTAVYGTLFKARGSGLLVSRYYKLVKQSNKWRIEDVSSQGTFKCSSNQVANNLNQN